MWAERLIRLDAPSFRRWAERSTGLSNWGDGRVLNHLRTVCGVLERANLSFKGRFMARAYYRWHLENRLRVVQQLERVPAIRDVPIERPIFITGWYRTGTTLLHRLMAADPGCRIPLTWELSHPAPLHPDPRQDEELRYARTERTFRWNDRLVPGQKRAHHITPDGPEECFFLLENDMVSTTLFNTFGGYDYGFEVLATNLEPTYRFLRTQMQLLTWDAERRGEGARRSRGRPRWVMKCPWHLWNLDVLLRVFPDACVIVTHRDVVKSLPSNCSLSSMTSRMGGPVDQKALGGFWRDYYRLGMDRYFACREGASNTPSPFFDLPLKSLTADAGAALEKAYDHFGLPFEPSLADAFRATLSAQPKDPHGKHEYALADFGFDEADLRRRFEDVAPLWR